MAKSNTNDHKTITSVVKYDLCTGCGTCVGLCPQDAVEMVIDHKKGIYIPLLDNDKCTECGLCFDVCPGHAVDFKQLNQDIFGKQPEDILLGNYLNCYIGHATDHDIRYNSASGGMVTALLVFALEEGLIDGALVTKMREDRPLEPLPFIARTRDEIISASKSKYCPVPANTAIKEILQAKDGERFAVVGLPCHIHGIRKAESVNKKLRERIAFHFGIFCGHSDRFSETEFILQKYQIKKENVAQIDYRGHGWPGSVRIGLNDGAERFIPFDDYMTLHSLRFFTPWRCVLCCDANCELADITFMDAWLSEVMAQDKEGKSIVISRTKASEALFQNAELKQIIEMSELAGSEVIRSQGGMQASKKDSKVLIALSRLVSHSSPNYTTKLLTPKPINYLRGSVVYFNMWMSSKGYMRKLIDPLAYIESHIFRG